MTVSDATRAPLSLQQDFLCTLDKGDVTGALGAKHIVLSAWRVRGPLEVDTLRAALLDLVRRHEMLRTSIVRGDEPFQVVHPAEPVRLLVEDLSATAQDERDARAERFYSEVETADYPVRELPHLRAALGRFADDDWVLALVVHHIAADGWSMRVLIRDLATRYAARRGHPVEDLPPVRQYREFVAEQPGTLTGPEVERAAAYWRDKLAGAEITTVATDRPVNEDIPAIYADHRSLIDADTTAATLRLAKATHSSPFMLFLGAFTVLLTGKSTSRDVVVGTFSSGRGIGPHQDTIGAFLNFLPLRVDLTGARTFRDVLERTRSTCLQAYVHDIPFPLIDQQAPDLIVPSADRDIIAFEVLQFPDGIDGTPVGDLTYSELRDRRVPQPVSCDIPDGALWALDVLPGVGTVSSLKFNTHLFDADTMWSLVHDYTQLLTRCISTPDADLW
ncbi:condensation domain-containing protein [Actinokineospora diospyrosa]|uniref:Condensation domain-containing protein n=1 Tax=Actinokineospora diospyrosa TaxID=103728 RepID=A0ABT1IE87_9PSEU|nr:condensation domain-containing protein [Actinokineospora diospyrosa]MCP2270953.1 Condensation domain-containing protein [Actinokineospora diospyrosa]